jgi:hypothetical protein
VTSSGQSTSCAMRYGMHSLNKHSSASKQFVRACVHMREKERDKAFKHAHKRLYVSVCDVHTGTCAHSPGMCM